MKSHNVVCANKGEGGVAQAGDAGILGIIDLSPPTWIDGHVRERHRGAVGDGDFIRVSERAGQPTTVTHGDVAIHIREVDVGLRPRARGAEQQQGQEQQGSGEAFLIIGGSFGYGNSV